MPIALVLVVQLGGEAHEGHVVDALEDVVDAVVALAVFSQEHLKGEVGLVSDVLEGVLWKTPEETAKVLKCGLRIWP